MPDESEQQAEGSACGCGGGRCCSGAGKWIWIALALAVVVVLIAKNALNRDLPTSPPTGVAASVLAGGGGTQGLPEPVGEEKPVPRLLDLGAGKCVPCKMMAPILADLKQTYVGKLDVQFIDVWENRDEGAKHGINVIPTQIFYDAQGRELFRHEGFFGKEDILAKWKELGVDLTGAAAPVKLDGGKPAK